MARPRKPLPAPVRVRIESLSHDGRGLAHVDGKALFVHGALPGELVLVHYQRLQRRYDEGCVAEVIEPAAHRVAPRCTHFGVCGGCALQHLDAAAQIGFKQATLGEVLRRIGRVTPERWLPPLAAAPWGYRRKARLGVRWVAKKGRVLVGFRERGSAFIADLQRCEVLHPSIGERLPALARLIEGLSIRAQVPQIEVAQGDGPVVLLFRVLTPPTPADCDRLLSFAAETGLHCYLQEGGAESVRPLPGQAVALRYSLPQQQVQIDFEPGDFTQVNLAMNRLMLGRALDLLAPQPDERVLDLFCGLGNFTLPIARRAGNVLGIEGDAGLVARARANAAGNAIGNVRFEVGDLYGDQVQAAWCRETFHKALIDPPRSGAWEVLEPLAATGIRRLVYVSCYPSTLARDAERLVKGLGFRFVAAGAMDMFPHTAHLEAMALFERA
ncbi:MAG: 23S rRNA (uracil(1939)-C(5))-methyltransferase RlmD [Chromatiaceae bacterium]|nr:MAG: 23S rRNA (uracil(1939)-C(5))-methyltransferase RlmD [Chromatiaceae bacterium]